MCHSCFKRDGFIVVVVVVVVVVAVHALSSSSSSSPTLLLLLLLLLLILHFLFILLFFLLRLLNVLFHECCCFVFVCCVHIHEAINIRSGMFRLEKFKWKETAFYENRVVMRSEGESQGSEERTKYDVFDFSIHIGRVCQSRFRVGS